MKAVHRLNSDEISSLFMNWEQRIYGFDQSVKHCTVSDEASCRRSILSDKMYPKKYGLNVLQGVLNVIEN